MNPKPYRSFEILDLLAEGRLPFALYRIPGQEVVLLCQPDGEPETLSGIEIPEGGDGFVVAPFQPHPTCPAVVIRADRKAEGAAAIDRLAAELSRNSGAQSTQRTERPSDDPTGREAYEKAFDRFADALNEGRFDKLVLSRRTVQLRPSDFSPATIFSRACRRYPDSFVALFGSERTGLWLCATPELLMAEKAGRGRTVALAGTLPESAPPVWDAKNRQEQALVADYVRDTLHEAGFPATESDPEPVRAGNVTHLKSEFRYRRTKKSIPISGLAARLHPTPAVCGLPKEEALRFIDRNEGYDRRYYAGFAGPFSPGACDFYVTLRCMEIGRKRVAFYAGGGLLPAADRTCEWSETEEKLQTMLSLLQS